MRELVKRIIIYLKNDCRTTYEFDHLLVICMDKNEPWKERVYIISRDVIGYIVGLAIVKPVSENRMGYISYI